VTGIGRLQRAVPAVYGSDMRRAADGTYVYADRPWLFTAGAGIAAFSFAGGLWQHFVAVQHVDAAVIGMALGIGASVAGAFCIPYSRFVFDPARKLITWTTHSVFNTNAGQIAFDNVKSVAIQTTTGDDGVLFYRVALSTADSTLPLGVEYSSNRARAEDLAATLRGILNAGPTR
jgi:hypothetical protein